MFQIDWKENAIENLNKLEASISQRIFKKVDELADNPFSKDIKRLKGSDHFRLRVGDYRVIFSIEGNLIIILKVGHRKHIYDR
ncbi:MAG TPA: type II toxin-antitoxin system RelE/ParE family toxin [Candidatus Nanoarchaeia archaeon]|nr:type II toxin-antitoxin system RelE/ParE family toxin [Candidatus Nanoarchaeia archaeon]